MKKEMVWAGCPSRHRHARPSTTIDYYLGRRAITTADFAAALGPPIVSQTGQ
jgi:hypothetical protein